MSSDHSAQLREARRRRILENMDKRLKKISALPSEIETSTAADSSLFMIEKTLNNVYEVQKHNEHDFITPQVAEPLLDEITATPVSQFISQGSSVEENKQELKSIKFLRSNEIHTMLIAITTFIVFKMGLGFLMYENILCPFITLCLVKLPSNWNSQSQKPFLLTAVLMLRAPSRTVNILLELIFRILGFSKDLCLYVFVFVFCSEIDRVLEMYLFSRYKI